MHNKIRKSFSITVFGLMTMFIFNLTSVKIHCQTVDSWQVEHMVRKHITKYPITQLADIYKSCFQDIFGSEHLASDTAAVIKYIYWEINQPQNENNPMYEPCGMQGNFIRVNIRAVKEGYIDARTLADAFIRSSSVGKQTKIEDWSKQWHEIVRTISDMNLELQSFANDSLYIEKMLRQGEYAWVHSRAYHDAYLPHYRIIEKNIFYNEIYPLLIRKNNQNN